jgi:acyl-homoserine-lactone acylase
LVVACLLSAASASSAPVRRGGEVLWDRYGVPHVYARSTPDLFYGFGWAQMKSHGELLLTLYAEGRGRAAEYFGRDELQSDRWMAINDVAGRAQTWLEAQTPEFRADLEAFADGMNAYAGAHPEALSDASRRVLPVSGADVVGYAERLFQYVYIAPQSLVEHLPPNSTPPGTAEPPGSNGWAIAPSRSASGKTMVLMNPHLPWGPGWSTYYEAQLSAPGIDLYGATQVGLPVLRFVFSDQLAITNTVDKTGGVTFYRIAPAAGGYMFDGKVRPFGERETKLKVRRPDGGFDIETVLVRSTVHGPVVGERDGAPIAMRVAGLDRPRALEQTWKMATARSFADYQAALALIQVPTFNILYGDRDGHIEYLFNGLVPRHSYGDLAYWSGVVPGDRSQSLWTSYLRYDELPKVIDPPGGTVQNSNDPPWNAAFPATLDPLSYRGSIAADVVNLRMARGIRMLAVHDKITFDDLLAARWSTHSELADRVLPDLEAAVNAHGDDLAKQAAAVLDRWDRTCDADSRGSLLFLAWSDRLGRPDGYAESGFATPYSLTHPLTTPAGLAAPRAALAALDAAAREMLASQGALDAPWSQVMRLRWSGVDLPVSGGPGRLGVFNVIDYAPAKDGVRAANFGSSFAAVVSLDSPTRAKVLMSYGNAAPGSPHAVDQAPQLSNERMRDAWRTRGQVEANLESRDVF